MLSRIVLSVRSCPHDKEWSLPMNRSPTLPTLKDVLDAIERLEPGTRSRSEECNPGQGDSVLQADAREDPLR